MINPWDVALSYQNPFQPYQRGWAGKAKIGDELLANAKKYNNLIDKRTPCGIPLFNRTGGCNRPDCKRIGCIEHL